MRNTASSRIGVPACGSCLPSDFEYTSTPSRWIIITTPGMRPRSTSAAMVLSSRARPSLLRPLPCVPGCVAQPARSASRNAAKWNVRVMASLHLVEKVLHLAKQLHAVLFHDHRVRAFADLDVALEGRAG